MDWNTYFMSLVYFVAMKSKDRHTKIGAVVVGPDGEIRSTGYNGLPRGIEDTKERLENRDLKYKIIVHAERNALLFARGSIKGCTIYTYPMMPCAVCASMIIQSGIKKVVAPKSDNPRWIQDMELSTKLFEEAGVVVELV